MRARVLAALVLVIPPLLVACDFDGAAPGVRGQCATAVGDPICDNVPIESSSDACWKLVQCGSIPVASAEDRDDFDYARCLARFDSIGDHRAEVSMACIEASTCDQLRFEGGRDTPRPNSESMPPCLEYGDPD